MHPDPGHSPRLSGGRAGRTRSATPPSGPRPSRHAPAPPVGQPDPARPSGAGACAVLMQLCVLAGADCPSSARPAPKAAQHADHLPVSARRPPASYWRASQPAADRSGFRLHASSLIRWSRKRAYGGGQPPREPTTCRTTGAGASQPTARWVAGPQPTASLAHRRVFSSSPLQQPNQPQPERAHSAPGRFFAVLLQGQEERPVTTTELAALNGEASPRRTGRAYNQHHFCTQARTRRGQAHRNWGKPTNRKQTRTKGE